MFFMPTILGLIAAITWGAGDFSGGIATKKQNAEIVVIFAHIASMILLISTAVLLGDKIPPLSDWLWGGAAGLGGGFGLLLLYSALASGRMAIAAPISAIVAAAIPVVYGWLTISTPSVTVIIGFILAISAIWLLAGGGNSELSTEKLSLPVFAGVAFGLFFICLHQASATSVIYPLIAVRIVSIISLCIFVILRGKQSLPTNDSWLPILLSGVFDTAGNAAFAVAARWGRVDSAAVIGSLYPGTTVLLAYIILREKINRKQLLGILFALSAIGLISF